MADDEVDKKGISLPEVVVGTAAGVGTLGAVGGGYAKFRLGEDMVKKAGETLAKHQGEALALAEAKSALAANAPAWEKLAGEAAQKETAALVTKAESSLKRVTDGTAALKDKSWIKKPFIAFSNASLPAKVAIGATVALATIGTGMAINSWRNKESYAERVRRERNNDTINR